MVASMADSKINHDYFVPAQYNTKLHSKRINIDFFF